MEKQELVLLGAGSYINLLKEDKSSKSFKLKIIRSSWLGLRHSTYTVTTTGDYGSYSTDYPIYLDQYLVKDKEQPNFFILEIFQTNAASEVWYKLNNNYYFGDSNKTSRLDCTGKIEGWPFQHRCFLWILPEQISQNIQNNINIEEMSKSDIIQYLRSFLSVGSIVHLEKNIQLELIRELGAGYFGITFKAKERLSGKLFAAKFQPYSYTFNDWDAICKVEAFKGANKFLVEMYGASSVLEILKDGSSIYNIKNIPSKFINISVAVILSELVDGDILDKFILNGRLNTTKDAIRISEEIANALITLHSHGYAHTDLKPENVLITNQGLHAKIIDFTTLTKIGEKPKIVAQSSFASPEQKNGELVTESSDIFSIGILLFFIATGYFPMPIATKENEGNWKIKSYNLVFPKRSQVNFAVDSVVKKATDMNPKRRYKNLSQLIDDLWLTNVPWGFNKDSLIVIIIMLSIMMLSALPKFLDFAKNGEMYASSTKRAFVGCAISIGAILLSFIAIYYLGKAFVQGSWALRRFFLQVSKLLSVSRNKFRLVLIGCLFIFVLVFTGIATHYQANLMHYLRKTPPSGLVDAMYFIQQYKGHADENFKLGQNFAALEHKEETTKSFETAIAQYQYSLKLCDRIVSKNKYSEEGVKFFNDIKSEIYINLADVYSSLNNIQDYIASLENYILSLSESDRLKEAMEIFSKVVSSHELNRKTLLGVEEFLRSNTPKLRFQYIDYSSDVRAYPSFSAPKLKGMQYGQEFILLNIINEKNSERSWALILFNGNKGYIEGKSNVRSLAE